MYACAPSQARGLLLATLAAIPPIVLAATSSGPRLAVEPELVMPFSESHDVPPDVAATSQCEHWPQDLSMRGAMQACSMWAELDTNERWLFEVRAQIADHQVVEMMLTEIDHDCEYCFDHEAPGREDRARRTLDAVSACMRQQLATARFDDATCTLYTHWRIQSDW